MELNTQTVWIEKDDNPKENGEYFVLVDNGEEVLKRHDNFNDYWELELISHDLLEVTHYLQPLTAYVLTEHQMKERDEKLIGEAEQRGYNRGYGKGCLDTEKEARAEIRANYKPNDEY